MSATNKSINYDLPIFVNNDYPSWLTDWNGAMRKIDETMFNSNSEIEDLKEHDRQTDNSINGLDGRIKTVEDDLNPDGTGLAKKVDTLETNVHNYDEQMEELDTVTTNLTTLCGTDDLKTSAKTLTGASNELYNRCDALSESGSTLGSELGNVRLLRTNTKKSCVDAINELSHRPSPFNIQHEYDGFQTTITRESDRTVIEFKNTNAVAGSPVYKILDSATDNSDIAKFKQLGILGKPFLFNPGGGSEYIEMNIERLGNGNIYLVMKKLGESVSSNIGTALTKYFNPAKFTFIDE